MKRMKLLVIMSFVFLTLSACADKNIENDNAEVKVENDVMQEKSMGTEEQDVGEESELIDEELLYEYSAKQVKNGNLYTLEINAPEGFYLMVNNTARMWDSVYFENAAGTQICVAPASDWDLERYENYVNNGIWESPWSDEIAEGDREVETPYGTVKLIIGNQIGRDEPYAETGFFNYNDVDWIIERVTGPGTEDIGKILNEMFTGKAELPEEKFPNMDVVVEDSEYSHILKSSDENVFGFNIDENRFEVSNSVSNSKMYFLLDGDKEYFMIGFTDGGLCDATYLKDFLVTGNVPTVVDLGWGRDGELLSIESKENINTKYGSTQIVYITIHDEDGGIDAIGNTFACDITCEECIFEVNGHEVIVQYVYPRDQIYEYQSMLKELLEEMF